MLTENSVGIAGAGRVARALGRALQDAGLAVGFVASRSREHAQGAADFIGGGVQAVEYGDLPRHASRFLIAVSDSAIEPVAQMLAAGGATSGSALHTCGAKGADALQALSDRGVSCGSLHPLQTIPDGPEAAHSLRGISFAFSGEGAAEQWALEIVELLHGHVLRIPPQARVLYHAAAVMASNYITVLLDSACQLMAASGVDEQEALRALEPIARASVENAVRLGTARALTGPIVRGDAATVAAHRKALSDWNEGVGHLYEAAGGQALEIACRRGLDSGQAAQVEAALRGARNV
ncbi:MAG TPA: Rossmann-like and DUF2520 domain-containing protein [Bryobacteraceae bacterium]|nr:Rossmann-like and DUF2520 domain-containing protein [Bryobacteraceae bacterium]